LLFPTKENQRRRYGRIKRVIFSFGEKEKGGDE